MVKSSRSLKARSTGSRVAAQAEIRSTVQPEAQTDVRLGTVMRFSPGASAVGIKQLETSGLRVASSRDFKKAVSVPSNFDGADVQYFERLGIAIVRSRSERVSALVASAKAGRTVQNARPEVRYRPLAFGATLLREMPVTNMRAPAEFDASYLRGYRDGMNQIIDHLLAEQGGAAPRIAAAFRDGATTWGLQAIKVPHTALTGKGIKVAVLDTGFDHTHPDFAGRTVVKKLFASQSSDDDVFGHGTHCIGTACGSKAPNGVPRYGVACEADIYAGKVLGDDGFGTDRSIIAGIEWALEQGCAVISMSLGAAVEPGAPTNQDYEQIGQVCLDAGTLIVAAAGNESNRPGFIAPVSSPANAKTIMSIAAVDADLRVASFSCGAINPGQEVDIAAPGVDVFSSVPGGGHDRMQGTSMATPHVAGVAALLAQSDATLRGKALWDRLLLTCRNLPSQPRDIGRGMVQI